MKRSTVKVTLIYRGLDQGSAFTPGERYCFHLQMLPDTGVVFMEGQKVSVAYKDWHIFHQKWQVVSGQEEDEGNGQRDSAGDKDWQPNHSASHWA